MTTNYQVLEEYIKEKMINHTIPGIAIGILQNDSIIYQKGFGYRNLEEKDPVTPQTIFSIASVTKSFIAMAIMKLAEEGKLSLQESVLKYIPEFKVTGYYDIERINIVHLLSHTTGIAPMLRKEEFNSLEDHINYFSSVDVDVLGDPGVYFSYSNDTFILLGIIIQRVTGKPFKNYIEENILEPLKMLSTGFRNYERMKNKEITTPYQFSTTGLSLESIAWSRLGNYEVGGGLYSNVIDLMQYGKTYFSPDNQFLSDMWNPTHQLSGDLFYGYGLFITQNYHNLSLVEHGGSQPGFSSHFGIVPEHNIAVAVLSNLSGVPCSDIWLAAVNITLGIPMHKKRITESRYNIQINKLDKFLGTYSSIEGNSIKVYLVNNQPRALIKREEFELIAIEKDSFMIYKTNKTLRFFSENGKKAWAVFNGNQMLRRIEE